MTLGKKVNTHIQIILSVVEKDTITIRLLLSIYVFKPCLNLLCESHIIQTEEILPSRSLMQFFTKDPVISFGAINYFFIRKF